MSQFLRNIIYRHQAGNANREASHIVQPRPKSRFENDANTGESLTRHDPKIESAIETAHTPLAPDLRMNKNADNDSLTPLPEQTIFSQETSIVDTQNQTEFPPTTKQPGIQTKPENHESNPRVHTILHRLNSQYAQNNKPSPARARKNTAAPKTAEEIDNKLLDQSTKSPFLPEQDSAFKDPDFKTLNVESQHFADPPFKDPFLKNQSFNQEGNDKKQTIENPPEQQKTHQAGLLQTPDWLAEMQSSLTERWQALNAQTEPEPVINVTIGRVEVRAIQTDSPTPPPQPDKKPSGIMSLSDYLEQRNKQNNKGQP
ncbi:hypothetical protein MNBD_GAMMA19-1672 [hydrothermal vent metagenome]|uniref:Uncharacterized protein n=1 Tax=hydrothermal vent metagenome TaxID=652676 RepID=A0A3B1AEW1_9ZZZZ